MTNKKHNRKNKHHDHQPSTPKIQINQEQLLLECLQLHQLLKDRTNKLRALNTGDFCYILSTKWLMEWKDYVGYQQTTCSQEVNSNKKDKHYGRKHPGKINTDILAPPNETREFYSLPQQMKEYDFLGQIIGQKKDKDDDYIAVTQDIWFAFLQYYEGEQIRRPVRKLKGSIFYDSEPLRCDTIFVNLGDQSIQENIKKTSKKLYNTIFPSQKMLLPSIWNYEQLHKFFSSYCRNTYGFQNIRIWKGFSYIATNPISESIVESIKQQKYLIKGRLLTLERYQDSDIDDYIKNTHTLIVEIGQVLVSDDKQDDNIKGYCQQCIKTTHLTISCICNEVLYCSQKCRINDQDFHYKTCEIAFDSQDDKQYQKKQSNQIPQAGLDNLGNTCYMNSVIQTILSIEHFNQFFSSNEYLKFMNEKELEDNNCMLLRKFSKTIKQMIQEEKSYPPWSLKSQIDYNLSTFKGDKQHDANDFLINFFNLINDYLSKVDSKAYNKLLQPFIGQFHSKVICPHCNIQSQNNEIFMQISLPIKSKPKQQAYSYCIVSSINHVIKGKANVYQSWTEMKQNVGVDPKTVIFISKQPEGLVLVDQQQKNPQKVVKGLKNELIYYKNLKPIQNQHFFVFGLVTAKTICGSKMKSSYGNLIVISMNKLQTTLGTFWLHIIKTFFYQHKDIVAQATKMQAQYLTEIEQAIKLSNQQKLKAKTESQTKQEQKEQEKQEDPCKKIIDHYNDCLKAFAQKIGIEVYINHYKRARNVCYFCNKKCQNCDLPKLFDKEFETFFASKYDQVRFQVYLSDQLHIETSQQDLSTSGDPTIHDCLALFNQPEQLDQQNAWYCQNCDTMALAFKQMQIKMFPSILIIHLNRFKTVDGKKMKNSDPISYNEIQMFGNSKYRLVGSVIHEGSMDAGHYWAICLRGEKYFVFNDSKVTPIDKVFHRNAYILVYCSLNFSF